MIDQNQRKVTPLRIALTGSAITAALLIFLVVAAYQRNTASATIQNDLETIRANFSQRKEADLSRIAVLEEELAQAQNEVQELQESFPELGEPFALYNQGQELAVRSQVTLIGISRMDSELLDTDQGLIQSTSYAIQLQGDTKTCLAYIQSLEDSSLQSVSPDDISISPLNKQCEFTARVFGLLD
ncbi:MAG: hypothetical protein U5K99_07375 [Anaerolineales bacterium]|nr:hypothetical protein [Anaerolineales bacterium]MDZ7844603.1 hypothetical protein [Anaerolineales bacterium]